MKVLLIDNYDSFTFNLFHYTEQLVSDVTVKRNDEISADEVSRFTHIIISPGPGLPAEAGITRNVIHKWSDSKAILGVCLGYQALAEYYGGELFNQNEVAHGVERKVCRTDEDSWLLRGMPAEFRVGLYHSWAVNTGNLSPDFKITARSEKGVTMAIEHQSLPLAGVQFHPESVMSESGLRIIRNWLFY